MVLLRQLTPLGSANMDYDIFASNYVINMAAGSTKGRTWWYPVDQLDAGAFYPVRDWPTRRDSTPSNIGYLFERNYLSGGAPGVWAPSGVSSGQTWNPETQSVNYMYATGIIGYNSRITWTPNPYYTGLPGYNPGGYHNLGTTSNMICADGHGVTLGDVYNGYGSPATYDVAGAPDYPYKWGIPLSQP